MKILSQKGFSLVEIMVVVAIVSILTAIAIPQYQKYQRKALQGEAKMLLSNMYTIERTFSLNWGYGTTNLGQMGFKATGAVNYNAGWPGSHKDPEGCNTNSVNARSNCTDYNGPVVKSTDYDLVNIHIYCPYPIDSNKSCYHDHPSVVPADLTSINLGAEAKIWNNKRKQTKFTIGATRTFGNSKQDSWIINHNKRLRNIKSGI